MKNRPKKIPKGLKRSAELSKAFSCFDAAAMHQYLIDLGFKRETGQWSWKRGDDRAYLINPEYGILYIDIYVPVQS